MPAKPTLVLVDVMKAFALMGASNAGLGARAPFHIEIVGETAGPLELASGVFINVQRAIDTIETSDIVIVPSILLRPEGWQKNRYPRLVDWLRRMHGRGALLCSACSGIFLLAETGLFDGKDVTVKVNKDTKVKAKAAVKIEEIKAGTRVVITAAQENDKSFTAKTIEVGVATAAAK